MGLGPGDPRTVTPQAQAALDDSQVVLGYKVYLELAEPLLGGQELISGRMTGELERAGRALDLALAGKRVSLVSGGDPGVYAMAAVVFEVARDRNIRLGQGGLELTVVPGVPAVVASAALLGAPLSHDFACVSLSDRLTPWKLIERRLEAVGAADFVVALYNPKSKGRDWQFDRALDILGRHREPGTPVGVVHGATRDSETVTVTTLAEVNRARVDMQTLVIIGNSQSFRLGDHMVTPRGYTAKYGNQGPDAGTEAE